MRYTAGEFCFVTDSRGAGRHTRLAIRALQTSVTMQATAGDAPIVTDKAVARRPVHPAMDLLLPKVAVPDRYIAGESRRDTDKCHASRQTTRASDSLRPKLRLPAQHKPAIDAMLPTGAMPAPYTRTRPRLLPTSVMSAPNQRQAIFLMTPMHALLATIHAANDLVQTHAELPPADECPIATDRTGVGLKHEACDCLLAAEKGSASLTKHGGRIFACYRYQRCPPRNTDAIELLSPLKRVRPPNQEASDQVLPMEALPPQPTRNP